MKASNRISRPEIVPMLTAAEVAAKLGTTRSAVYNLCYKPGGLRSYKVGKPILPKKRKKEVAA